MTSQSTMSIHSFDNPELRQWTCHQSAVEWRLSNALDSYYQVLPSFNGVYISGTTDMFSLQQNSHLKKTQEIKHCNCVLYGI